MATYGGTPFHDLAPQGMVPDWHSEPMIARRHVPTSNVEVVQFFGTGNPRLSVTVRFDSDSDMAALRAMVADGVGRALTLFGVTYTGVYLVGFRQPRKAVAANYRVAELEFERFAL